MKLYSNYTSGFLIAFGTLVSRVAANADKIIFTGPAPVTYPLASPSLTDLNLSVLGPENLIIRTNLSRIFHHASDTDTKGKLPGLASWFMLDDLTPGQRYELRVCWAAIEPTEFNMDVHELDNVLETPDLLRSLYDYAGARQAEAGEEKTPKLHKKRASTENKERTSSLLLLRVHAAADYFSHDKTLMTNTPPPVLVDLILDPYLFNAVPQSLVPTTGYIAIVAVVTFLLAKWIASRMTAIAGANESVSKKKD